MRAEIPRLLLIEEDPTLADITAFRLELSGYEVATANTGAEAQKQLAENPPSLMIIDLVLPDMDGVDLINGIKNDPETNQIPVLVFSVDADLEQVERAFSAGAEDYLVTPYDPAVLEAKLEKLLEAVS